MKKGFILGLILVVFFCLPLMAEEQKTHKPTLSFSLAGGKMRGEFTLGGDLLYNQRWGNWAIQTAAMVNYNKFIHEYGFSGGGSFWLADFLELGLFVDTLLLEKTMYGYAGFHGQVRPELRMFLGKNFFLNVFYAHPFTRPHLLSEVTTGPIFRMDDEFYYYDTTLTRTWARAVRYAGGEAQFFFKPVRLYGEWIYAFKEEMTRLVLGAEVRLFGFLGLGVEWMKMTAEPAIGLFVGGNYSTILGNLKLYFGREASQGLTLKKSDIITPRYPIVVVKEESATTTETIERMDLDLKVQPKDICLGASLTWELIVSGGVPDYTYEVKITEAGVTKTFESAKGTYKPQSLGRICIEAIAYDSKGHSVSACECVNAIDCTKKYKLTVTWCAGVGGNPSEGVYTYKEGETVKYSYFLVGDYINLRVTVDGSPVPIEGNALMNKDHVIVVCSDKKDCPPAKILTFTASKTEIYPGEEVTFTWTTQNANKTTFNDGNVALNGSIKVNPTATTTYTLKAFNDCPSQDIKTITITVKNCEFCNKSTGVTFDPEGSFALTKDNFPEGQDIVVYFSVYNKSGCPWGEPIKYQIKYQDGNELIKAGQDNIGTIPAHTRWDMKLIYDWSAKTAAFTFLSSSPLSEIPPPVVQCDRKVQVKLSLGSCGPL